MKFAYPQDATSSVSSVRRLDESSDAATQQSNLERKQDIATVGETVPLIFCNRGDYGNDQGVNGGVWISPRLIQLGIEQTNLSMMYLLSQGRVEGLKKENVYWGYQKLEDKDPSASFCYAYEEIPPCLDLDYEPGGSLSWTTTVQNGGPTGTGSFTTEKNCQKIVITWQSVIEVRGSAVIVGGFGGQAQTEKNYGKGAGYNDGWYCYTISTRYQAEQPGGFWFPKVVSSPDAAVLHNTGGYYYDSTEGNTYKGCRQYWNTRRWNMASKHVSGSWEQQSEVRLKYQLYRVSDNTLIEEGFKWVQHGTSSITFDGLEPDEYRVVLSDLYKERNKPVETVTIPEPYNCAEYASWFSRSYPSLPPSGFIRHTSNGQETQIINSTITQTIYNQIDFPDLPGGEQQLVGGLSDLTMVGIAGDVTKLRPIDGPEYFLQSHLFVEQGIEVKSLVSGRVEASKFYPDLVRYLLEQTHSLKNDQIDEDSLRLACRMHQRYSMYFNGVLQTTSNLATWLTKTAPYFLCTLRQVDGRYGLAPIAPLDSNYEFSRDPVVPDHIFDADEITADSYSRTYISPVDRRPICLVMVYRDQPEQSVGQNVTVEVRYAGTALSGPFEQHDLTEFCCTPGQATYAARYILARRRYTTHTCELTVNRAGRNIVPGQIVRVDLALQTSEGAGVNDSTFYQVETVQEGQGGMVNLELVHFPVDINGVSIIAKEVHEGAVTIQ